MANLHKGWLLAFATCILWGLYTIFLKEAANYLEHVNGLVVVLQATIAGSFLLLIFAGYGRLSIETLRSGKSWTFGTLQLLNNIFIFAALTYSITATSLTLLARFSIVVSILITFICDKKSDNISILGFIMVALGLVVVSASLDAEYRGIILFWVFLMCLTKVHRSRVIVKHEANKKATGDFKTELRVTGYILAITSCFYALLLFLTMSLDFNSYAKYIVPTHQEFFALSPLLLAMGVGSILMASMRYCEIVSTKHIGATNFLTVMAFTPVFTYIAQLMLYCFDKMEFPYTNIYELSGGALVVVGAVLLTRKATRTEKTLNLNYSHEDLMIVKDSITATKIYFKDDLVKTAECLGLSVEKLNNIMLDEEKPAQADIDTILTNYNNNITGLDYLTASLNKKAFLTKCDELKFLRKATVMTININSLTEIADFYGQDVYKIVLIEISNRLAKIVKLPDIIARTSANEFSLIIYNSKCFSNKLLKTIINKTLAKPFIIEELEHKIYLKFDIN